MLLVILKQNSKPAEIIFRAIKTRTRNKLANKTDLMTLETFEVRTSAKWQPPFWLRREIFLDYCAN